MLGVRAIAVNQIKFNRDFRRASPPPGFSSLFILFFTSLKILA